MQGIHRSLVNSSHKSQWRRALMFSLICTWTNGWANSWDAGDLRCHCTHYNITVMLMASNSVRAVQGDCEIIWYPVARCHCRMIDVLFSHWADDREMMDSFTWGWVSLHVWQTFSHNAKYIDGLDFGVNSPSVSYWYISYDEDYSYPKIWNVARLSDILINYFVWHHKGWH